MNYRSKMEKLEVKPGPTRIQTIWRPGFVSAVVSTHTWKNTIFWVPKP